MEKPEKTLEKREKYAEILRNVDEKERELVWGVVEEIIYCEVKMEELKTMPFIIRHPKHPDLTKITPAARLYRDMFASYSNGIRILINVLRKVESDAQDELLRKLEEFSL